MNAPERIWCHPIERQPVAAKGRKHAKWIRGSWKNHNSRAHGDVEYVRADLAAVPAQVQPDCCDICRGKTFAETADGKGWRCVECKAIWLREPQPDPRDEVIARLADAVEAGIWLGDTTELWGHANHMLAFAAFNGSLDAAKSLHEAVLPEMFWNMGHLDALSLGYVCTVAGDHFADSTSWRGYAMTPARAWLLAIIRALAQGQVEVHKTAKAALAAAKASLSSKPER